MQPREDTFEESYWHLIGRAAATHTPVVASQMTLAMIGSGRALPDLRIDARELQATEYVVDPVIAELLRIAARCGLSANYIVDLIGSGPAGQDEDQE